MSEEKAILVINATVNKANMEDVQTYIGKIGPVLEKNGGQPVGRYQTIQDVAGTDSPEIISIFEFASVQAINEMVSSDDFTELAELRAKAFSKLNLMICKAS